MACCHSLKDGTSYLMSMSNRKNRQDLVSTSVRPLCEQHAPSFSSSRGAAASHGPGYDGFGFAAMRQQTSSPKTDNSTLKSMVYGHPPLVCMRER